MACYLGSKDLYKKCLLYDDIMANTEKETTELFEALGQIFFMKLTSSFGSKLSFESG